MPRSQASRSEGTALLESRSARSPRRSAGPADRSDLSALQRFGGARCAAAFHASERCARAGRSLALPRERDTPAG